jgi:hypothetical protein
MEWIHKYSVEKVGSSNTVSGFFSASSGKFEIKYKGDGGNADEFVITLSGGQYDSGSGKPITFTITGAWEIREVIEMFTLLGFIINK